MSEKTELCASCGLPGHRYGTTDRNHKFDAMGCVNSLKATLADQGDALVIRRDENGKWQFDHTALDGYPDLYEFSPKQAEAMEALGVPIRPTNNGYIINSVLDALSDRSDTP